ncbi:sulfite exporter TauE/SafE family protein [Vogesella indigofera]|uniref:sulfite exporter TauE/SafE family protein n=1 Tax=Vogesella indigofera TaxID=45465 RepID=UPI00234F21D8|nr:TSUP family transporter [Vogesella indigofera]MDC7701427.1 TSUP family transporter [Vogesella indigofera]
MLTLAMLCGFAFCAGLIDAAVGGGGLIQIPALFNLLPSVPSATLLGSNKLASACGTSLAARTFIGRVRVPWSLVLPAAISAFAMAFLGAAAVSSVPQTLMRPLVLVLIVVMAIYTFRKKDFGQLARPQTVGTRERVLSVLIGGGIGFYDGLFGPGTGSFLIFLFVRCFAFDFLQASAASKFVNLATNIAALSFFVPAGKVLYGVALPMAACNMLGAVAGSRLAMRHGTGFVRGLFLGLLLLLIVKLGYDMLK